MRVFVTGASGHIASAVIPELRAAGHQVVGLARSDAAAAAVVALGAEARRGHLDDLDGLRAAAAAADGVIHLALKHEAVRAGRLMEAVEANSRALAAMGDGLAESGGGKSLAAASATLMLSFGGVTGRTWTEADLAESGPQAEAENFVIALSERGVRSVALRLPPLVHSDLDRKGFTPALIESARAKGYAGYPGDGANRWPAVHTRDVARLFRLALEQAPAGTRLHGVADEGVALREIAEALGRNLDLPVKSVPVEEQEEYFRYLAPFIAIDNPSSAVRTRELIEWEPNHAALIEDIDAGHYFTPRAG